MCMCHTILLSHYILLIDVVSAIICPSSYAFIWPPLPSPLVFSHTSPLVQTSLCQGLPDKRWHTKLQTQCKLVINYITTTTTTLRSKSLSVLKMCKIPTGLYIFYWKHFMFSSFHQVWNGSLLAKKITKEDVMKNNIYWTIFFWQMFPFLSNEHMDRTETL